MALDQHAPGVRPLEPRDDAQERRLAAAARAEQRGERPAGDLDRDVVERDERAELLRDGSCFDHAALLGLEQAHRDERRDREECEDDGRRVGADVVEGLEALLDVQRHRLGLADDAPGDDADGAELAERARGRQDDAVGDRPADRGQRDAPEGLPRRRAERRRGLLLLDADLAQHGHDLAHDERAARRRSSRAPSPGSAKTTSNGRSWSHPPVPKRSRNARPTTIGESASGRSTTALRSPLPGTRCRTITIAHAIAEDGVRRHDDQRDQDRDPERVDRLGCRDRRPGSTDAVLERPPEDHRDRQERAAARGSRAP